MLKHSNSRYLAAGMIDDVVTKTPLPASIQRLLGRLTPAAQTAVQVVKAPKTMADATTSYIRSIGKLSPDQIASIQKGSKFQNIGQKLNAADANVNSEIMRRVAANTGVGAAAGGVAGFTTGKDDNRFESAMLGAGFGAAGGALMGARSAQKIRSQVPTTKAIREQLNLKNLIHGKEGVSRSQIRNQIQGLSEQSKNMSSLAEDLARDQSIPYMAGLAGAGAGGLASIGNRFSETAMQRGAGEVPSYQPRPVFGAYPYGAR